MPRIAVVRKERCNPQGCGNYLCIRVCPVNREGKDCITKEPSTKVRVDPYLCVGCQICVVKCPFDVLDRKSTRLNSSHIQKSRMPSSA